MSDEAATPKKRGPKPLGDRPMTATERKRRSRGLQAQSGVAEFTVQASGATLEFIDWFAVANGIPRSQVVGAFLDLAIKRLGEAAAMAAEHVRHGGTYEGAMSIISRELTFTPDTQLQERLRHLIDPT